MATALTAIVAGSQTNRISGRPEQLNAESTATGNHTAHHRCSKQGTSPAHES